MDELIKLAAIEAKKFIKYRAAASVLTFASGGVLGVVFFIAGRVTA